MGKKHGVWFDLAAHLAIHKDVLNKFSWLSKSTENKYSIMNFTENGCDKLKHSIIFETTNGFIVNISKETLISKHDPTSAMTVDFAYGCMGVIRPYHLRYHAAHSIDYNPVSPWHNKPHRHEFDGKTQKIDIYSHDHRATKDQNKKYTWKNSPVNLTFLEHEDWPFISEFLEEVSQLN